MEVKGLNELANVFIWARLEKGLTQKELGERLGIKEQQIQRYEAQKYKGASFQRLSDIGEAIGIKITVELT